MVYERTSGGVHLYVRSFDLKEESQCYFQFQVHPRSKHKTIWMSMEGEVASNDTYSCPQLAQKESTIPTPPHLDGVQIAASGFNRFSYPLLWALLPLQPFGDSRSKDSLLREIISWIRSELLCGESHKLWMITMRVDVVTICLLGKEDVNYKNWLLKRGRAKLDKEECCSICLEAMGEGFMVTRLPCSHVFHAACVFRWLRDSSATCPLCRFQVPLLTS